MNRKNLSYLIVLPLLLLLLAPLASQERDARDIDFAADQVDFDEKQKRIRLVGNVVITSDGSKVSAPTAVYYTEKQYAEFLGGVTLVGENSTATGREMKVWYGESRGRLKGAVRLESQNGVGKGSAEPTVVLSEALDYNWKTEEGAASGGVKMRQGQKQAFADRAEIYQKRNEILLIGNVRVEQGAGDWLTAQRAVYDTGKQTVRAEGRVVAKARLQQKEAPKEADPVVAGPGKTPLPAPLLVEPSFEFLPLRRLPSVPLPWLGEETSE